MTQCIVTKRAVNTQSKQETMILRKKSCLKYWIIMALFTTVNIYRKYHKIVPRIKQNTSKYKYILQWTLDFTEPFKYMGKGTQGFIDKQCQYTNCYVTSNKTLFGTKYSKFDVIVFYGPDLVQYPFKLPKMRSMHQKYVFASIESPVYYPICSLKYDNYFNWTWTYRLDSDLRWGYIVIRDVNNKVIGPKINMHWINIENMAPVSEDLKNKLRFKTKIAAWFASNCETFSHREYEVKKIQEELLKYDKNYYIDIYGRCGNLNCSRDDSTICNEKIKRLYHFYFAFENSLSEDYVTEKLLYALQNNAVPVVFGGANYSRFMPDGIYLNVDLLGAANIAKKMHELMTDFEKYANYFKWKNHYSYHLTSESAETSEYCQMCKLMNDEELVRKTSESKGFIKWWNLISDETDCWENF